jgi:SAM-dependent methyltransferase
MGRQATGFFEGTEMPTAGRALRPDPVRVLGKVGVNSDMDVIDLCSGDGWFTLQIAEPARHVVERRPRVARGGAPSLAGKRRGELWLRHRHAYDIRRLWPRPVDFVFLANAFHGVADRLWLARSVRDALKPSGRFAIINWHPWPRERTTVLGEPLGPRTQLRMSPDQTIKAAEFCDLRFSKLVDVPPYHCGVVFERI